MIVVRFQRSLPLRVAEWSLAAMLTSWGAILMAQPQLFVQMAAFSALDRWAPQPVWAAACLVVGSARLAVLAINGAWRASPALRAVMAALALLFWAQISLGLVLAPIKATGLAIYPWMILLEFWNVYRAAGDARDAMRGGSHGE